MSSEITVDERRLSWIEDTLPFYYVQFPAKIPFNYRVQRICWFGSLPKVYNSRNCRLIPHADRTNSATRNTERVARRYMWRRVLGAELLVKYALRARVWARTPPASQDRTSSVPSPFLPTTKKKKSEQKRHLLSPPLLRPLNQSNPSTIAPDLPLV